MTMIITGAVAGKDGSACSISLTEFAMRPLSNLSTWLSRRRGPTLSERAEDPGVKAPGDEASPVEPVRAEPDERPQYTIGALAEAIGIQPNGVVYYERIGLLPKPPRTMGNYRAYSAQDLARIKFIRRARDLGFSLEQVRTLLQLADNKCADLWVLSASARNQLTEINRRISQLNALRRSLNDVIAQCDAGEVSKTQIIKALSSHSR
ncbi:MAG TPA: MerR family transcriptional regulator [Hyphomonadaceae bacterium]|nr:MerR family transcriptional regulator [Hyphomonadaceae bacterium]